MLYCILTSQFVYELLFLVLIWLVFVLEGLSAAKVLVENGMDVVILEASDRIGGRVCKENFGGVSVELGAGWIVGVGGKEPNPVWELAIKSSLRTCFSDYSNARYNIYDRRFEFWILIVFISVFPQSLCVSDFFYFSAF